MFKSRADAKVKPSSCCNVSAILGIGKGFLKIWLLTFLKSVMKRTVPSFFGIIKTGVPHCDSCTFSSTRILTKRISSLLNVSLLMRGTGYHLALTGLAPGFSSILTGVVFHRPSVPSKSSSNSLSNRSSCSFCLSLRLSALLTTSSRSAFL